MNAQVTNIKIKYGEKEIELTQEEAKALQSALNGLFAKDKSLADSLADQYRKVIEAARKSSPQREWNHPLTIRDPWPFCQPIEVPFTKSWEVIC